MKHPELTRFLAIIAVAAFGLAGVAGLQGCNTVRGAGEDVESAGRGVSGAAEETQDEIFEE
jgi:predicted small secreted protein